MTDLTETVDRLLALREGITPGKWSAESGHVQQNGQLYWQVTDGNDAIMQNQFCWCQGDHAANARLIAAAPEILDAIEALAKENAALTVRTEEAERACDGWRNDYRALEKAIVGDTGLSAMLIATQARLFKPRAEAAEAKVARDSDLILDAYKAILVLHRILDKIGLDAGTRAAHQIADRIVAAHPEVIGRAALREIGDGNG